MEFGWAGFEKKPQNNFERNGFGSLQPWIEEGMDIETYRRGSKGLVRLTLYRIEAKLGHLLGLGPL